MPDNVTRSAEQPWRIEAVRKLEEFWRAGAPPHLIAQALGRSESEIRTKAHELGLGVGEARH